MRCRMCTVNLCDTMEQKRIQMIFHGILYNSNGVESIITIMLLRMLMMLMLGICIRATANTKTLEIEIIIVKIFHFRLFFGEQYKNTQWNDRRTKENSNEKLMKRIT